MPTAKPRRQKRIRSLNVFKSASFNRSPILPMELTKPRTRQAAVMARNALIRKYFLSRSRSISTVRSFGYGSLIGTCDALAREAGKGVQPLLQSLEILQRLRDLLFRVGVLVLDEVVLHTGFRRGAEDG